MDLHCELMSYATLSFNYDRELVNTREDLGYGSGTGSAYGSLDCRGLLNACASCLEKINCSGKDYMIKGV